jgi:glutamate--cysteine ligase
MHLGTLFPEVRLKKTLELRGADSLPRDLVPALPALAKGLLYDAQARAHAEALAERVDPAAAQAVRPEIAQRGLSAQLQGRPLADWAGELLDVARAGLERFALIDPRTGRDESLYLEPLSALVQHGQTPADRLLGRLDANRDLVPQVLEYARL